MATTGRVLGMPSTAAVPRARLALVFGALLVSMVAGAVSGGAGDGAPSARDVYLSLSSGPPTYLPAGFACTAVRCVPNNMKNLEIVGHGVVGEVAQTFSGPGGRDHTIVFRVHVDDVAPAPPRCTTTPRGVECTGATAMVSIRVESRGHGTSVDETASITTSALLRVREVLRDV